MLTCGAGDDKDIRAQKDPVGPSGNTAGEDVDSRGPFKRRMYETVRLKLKHLFSYSAIQHFSYSGFWVINLTLFYESSLGSFVAWYLIALQ